MPFKRAFPSDEDRALFTTAFDPFVAVFSVFLEDEDVGTLGSGSDGAFVGVALLEADDLSERYMSVWDRFVTSDRSVPTEEPDSNVWRGGETEGGSGDTSVGALSMADAFLRSVGVGATFALVLASAGAVAGTSS